MKRLKNIYRRQISEHCGDPLAHPEYDTENVQMNYNDYEGRMAKQNRINFINIQESYLKCFTIIKKWNRGCKKR